jgi:hypothetical protein
LLNILLHQTFLVESDACFSLNLFLITFHYVKFINCFINQWNICKWFFLSKVCYNLFFTETFGVTLLWLITWVDKFCSKTRHVMRGRWTKFMGSQAGRTNSGKTAISKCDAWILESYHFLLTRNWFFHLCPLCQIVLILDFMFTPLFCSNNINATNSVP